MCIFEYLMWLRVDLRAGQYGRSNKRESWHTQKKNPNLTILTAAAASDTQIGRKFRCYITVVFPLEAGSLVT